MRTLLPSGMPLARLRSAAEEAIVHGQLITVQAPDLLALLVALDLRERLDPDVEILIKFAKTWARGDDPFQSVGLDQIDEAEDRICEAAERVLKHEPKPDLSGAPS